MKAVSERWEQLAIAIGDSVRGAVNTPEMIGGRDETGYILMFFNAQRHEGKATMVSSLTDTKELKMILETVICQLDGPKSKIVNPTMKN